jgi:hypothetical protein
MAAAVDWRIAAPHYGERMKYLATMAAGDADHDLDTTFRDVFRVLSKIGVTGGLDEPDGIKFEWKLLNRLLHFRQIAGKNDGDEDATGSEKEYQESFIATYLPTAAEVAAGIVEKGSRQVGVKMFLEEEQQYNVKTLYAAQPRDHAVSKERDFTLKGAEMFNWLDVHGKGSIAFVIDAQNVAFVDAFQQGDKKSAGVAYSFITRESVNDPAGKETFPPHKEADNVRVVNILDKCSPGITQNIIYPQTPPETYAWRKIAEEMFFSKFDLNVTCINPDERLKSVTMGFTSKSLMKQHIMMKGSKEDAFPGAITTIKENIEALGDPRGWDEKKTDLYFTEIQQKRSGDWLQDICCRDVARFRALAQLQDLEKYREFQNVFLVTHDRICLAFGLLMGIDVLFTYYINHTSYLVYFTKSGAVVPPHEQLKREILNMKSVARGFDYGDLESVYNFEHALALSTIKAALIAEMRKVPPSSTDALTKHLKKVLKIATDLSVFYALSPPLEDVGDFYSRYGKSSVDVVIPEGTPTKDLDAIRNQFYTFNRNVVKIHKSHLGKLTDRDKQLTTTGVRSFFDGFKVTIEKATPAKKDKYKAIDEIFIFTRSIAARAAAAAVAAYTGLFEKKKAEERDDPRKGAGVFSYLNSTLDADTRREFIDFLTRLNTAGVPVAEKPKLDSFVVATKFLIADSGAVPAPSKAQVPNLDLIDSVDVVKDPIPKPEEITAAEVAALKAEVGITAAVAAEAAAEPVDVEVPIVVGDAAVRAAENAAAAAAEVVAAPPAAAVVAANRAKKAVAIRISKEKASSYRVTDFVPSIKLIANRAKNFFTGNWRREVPGAAGPAPAEDAGIEERVAIAQAADAQLSQEEAARAAPYLVGGGDTPDHSPHTTFYLLLRELSFRLSLDDQSNYTTVLDMSQLVHNIYANGPNEYDYLTFMEYFILTQSPNHLCKSEADGIVRNFLDGYYGMIEIPEDYRPSYTAPEETVAKILAIETLTEDKEVRDRYIALKRTLMDTIMAQLEAMESPVENVAMEEVASNVVMEEAAEAAPMEEASQNNVRHQATTKRWTQRKRKFPATPASTATVYPQSKRFTQYQRPMPLWSQGPMAQLAYGGKQKQKRRTYKKRKNSKRTRRNRRLL